MSDSSSSSSSTSTATFLEAQRSAPQQLEAERFKGSKVAHRLRKDVVALEHAFTKHQLLPKLESRPDQENLIARGILRSEGHGASSRIQATQRKLQHNMTTDKVGHLLERRSEIGSLQQQNIIKDMHIAPALQAQSRALQKNLARANLYHALKHRPTVAELQARGIYGERPAEDSVGEHQDDSIAVAAPAAIVDSGAVADLEPESLPEDGRTHPDEQPHDEAESAGYERKQGGHGEISGRGGSSYSAPLSSGGIGMVSSGTELEPSSSSSTAGLSSSVSSSVPPSSGTTAIPSSLTSATTTYQRRSKNFHLTRILLKFVASLAEAGEISLQQKGILKDLIVDQDASILAVAECFDAEHDLNELKDSLTHLAAARQ